MYYNAGAACVVVQCDYYLSPNTTVAGAIAKFVTQPIPCNGSNFCDDADSDCGGSGATMVYTNNYNNNYQLTMHTSHSGGPTSWNWKIKNYKGYNSGRTKTVLFMSGQE